MANELRNRGLFDGMMQDWFDDNIMKPIRTGEYMKTDIAETDKEYRVKVDMPGFQKKDIHINYDKDLLTISGKRDTFDDEADKDGNILHSERRYGQMSREYRLPDVDVAKVHAKYTDGVLIVTLPKLVDKQENGNHIDIE